MRAFVRLPWLTLLKEAWTDRYATAGDLRLEFMDIRRPPKRNPEALRRVLNDALGRLSAAGQGFGELVTSHLRTVVATDDVRQEYALPTSAWGSTFEGQSSTNGHFVACELIWAATAIRLARDAKAAGRHPDLTAMREACWAAQQRFLHQFDDADVWIDYLKPNLGPDSGMTNGAA